jgi:integral membrane protein
MIFLVTAFMLSRKARWDIPFTAVTLLCGTVPLLSFWAERRATARVRAEHARTLEPVGS